MGKLIAVIILVAAGAAGLYWLQVTTAAEEDIEPAVPIDPPAGAFILEDFKPAGVVMTALGPRDPAEQQAAINAFIDAWVPERGWTGEAEEVKVSNGITRFAVEVHDTTVVGMCFIVCEVPGKVEGLENGKRVRFRGRVKDIRESPDLMTQPRRLILDQVTVLRVG